MVLKSIPTSTARYLWVTLVAVMLLVAAFVLYVRAEAGIENAREQRHQSFRLADELRQSSDDLTRMVRAYAITGTPLFKQHFQEILDIRDGKRPRPENYENVYWDLVLEDDKRPGRFGQAIALLDLMREAGFTNEEFDKLQEAKQASDVLTQTEFAAMKIVESSPSVSDRFSAILMLNDPAYLKAKAGIMKPIGEFNDMVDRRTSAAVKIAEAHAARLRLLVILLGLLVAFLMSRLLSAINKEYQEKTASKRLLDSIIENIPNMIFLKRAEDLRFVLFNKAGEQLLGYDRADLLGKSDYDLFPKEQADLFTGRDREVLRSTEVMDIPEEPIDTLQLGQRLLHTRKLVLRNSRGEAEYLLGISEDITAQKQGELELEQYRDHLERLVEKRTAELTIARTAAEAANIAKSAFLANMSHEIRTPMNGIIGMANILRREGVTSKQAQRLDTIDAAAQHLLSVINDVLDISKIEAGKFTLAEAPVVVSSLMTNVSSILSGQVKAKGIHLQTETEHFPHNLVGDPTRLQQALLNYATNAVKFTEQGTVTLRALKQEETADAVQVRFVVEDTGFGIAPEIMSRLFSSFEQADNSMIRKYGGTGLGLAITKRLAELMGGEVGADSMPGVGSTFWFTAKLKKGGEAAVSKETAVNAEAEIRRRYSGQRILVVDDEPVNREVAVMQLEAVDLVADTAEDGAEAVEMARKNCYAAIFMDMQMPKLNGLEATQQVRTLSGYGRTPIIAMTANAFAEDKAQCLAAGMNDFLMKPFNPDELFAILLNSLSRSEG